MWKDIQYSIKCIGLKTTHHHGASWCSTFKCKQFGKGIFGHWNNRFSSEVFAMLMWHPCIPQLNASSSLLLFVYLFIFFIIILVVWVETPWFYLLKTLPSLLTKQMVCNINQGTATPQPSKSRKPGKPTLVYVCECVLCVCVWGGGDLPQNSPHCKW